MQQTGTETQELARPFKRLCPLENAPLWTTDRQVSGQALWNTSKGARMTTVYSMRASR